MLWEKTGNPDEKPTIVKQPWGSICAQNINHLLSVQVIKVAHCFQARSNFYEFPDKHYSPSFIGRYREILDMLLDIAWGGYTITRKTGGDMAQILSNNCSIIILTEL